MVVGLSLLVSACASDPESPEVLSPDNVPVSPVTVEPSPPADDRAPQAQSFRTTPGAVPFDPDPLIYYQRQRAGAPVFADNERVFLTPALQLNFVNVPADQVAQAVIREALGETVAIAEGVTGTITLSSDSPVPTRAALQALETVLASSGLALIERPSGFILTTLAEARGGNQSIQTGSIGYGVTLLPIENTSPSNIVSLITPLIGNTVTVSADDNLGIMTLAGPQADVAQAIEAIRLFDTPSLTGRVFGMFEIRYTDVSAIRTEIESLINASNDAAGNLVQLIELPRLNRLFVVARTQAAFAEVRDWVDRLDVVAGGDERRLRYYVAQNAPADILAQQLSAALGVGGQSFGALTAGPANVPQPGQPAGFTGQTAPRAVPAPANRDALSIVPDQLNNALIIRATDAEYREVLTLVERMDVLPPQVLIEATIAEVTLSDDLSFGVRWFFNSGDFTVSFSDNSSGAVGPVFPGFSGVFANGISAALALNTLSSLTDVTVLSAPSIMVQNNQIANLQVGDEVPILTQQSTGVSDPGAPIVNTIQLRETGVILDVRPRINASDMVVLDISQEVSQAVPTVTAGINSPTIRQRQFTSTVAVRNNGTIILGGLIQESVTDNETSIPILGRTPLIGNLFKSQSDSVRRTELIIFLTPRIIRNDTDAADALRYLTDELSGLQQRLEERE